MSAQVGDVITASPIGNVNGGRYPWRGIVTHAGENGVSAVGIDHTGSLAYLSNYSDEVTVQHIATSGEARATLAGLYARDDVNARTKTRLHEIARLVAFDRLAAVFPTGGEKPSRVVDRVYSIIYTDSGPASTELDAQRRAKIDNQAREETER